MGLPNAAQPHGIAPGEEALVQNVSESGVNTARWWKFHNLRKLNLLMFIPLLSIFSQGLVLLSYQHSVLAPGLNVD